MNKILLGLLLVLVSGCAGASRAPDGKKLQGEWTFRSQSPSVCWDSGPKFEKCEIGVVISAELECVDAWIKPHEQAMDRLAVQLDCKIERKGDEAKLTLTQYAFPSREGALVVSGKSDPELSWNTPYGSYQLVHVSHEVTPRVDGDIVEE